MEDDINLQEIREGILSGDYGRFDFVEKILTQEELLYSKPRVVFKAIAKRIYMSEDKMNRKTFWAWLRRYKEKYRLLNPEAGATTLNSRPRLHPTSCGEKKVPDLDWLHDFKPSEPENTAISPLVINVVRSNRNSQKQ